MIENFIADDKREGCLKLPPYLNWQTGKFEFPESQEEPCSTNARTAKESSKKTEPSGS